MGWLPLEHHCAGKKKRGTQLVTEWDQHFYVYLNHLKRYLGEKKNLQLCFFSLCVKREVPQISLNWTQKQRMKDQTGRKSVEGILLSAHQLFLVICGTYISLLPMQIHCCLMPFLGHSILSTSQIWTSEKTWFMTIYGSKIKSVFFSLKEHRGSWP